MSDAEFLEALGIDLDPADFSERVGLILGDHADNPTDHQLDKAREQALMEFGI